MNTKKILLYTGGALALGGVAFFVWSFFKKVEIPIGNTTIGLGTQSDEVPAESNPNPTDVVDNNTTPNTADNSTGSGFPPKFNPSINNPFQPLDEQPYSDLDALIHKGV